MQLSYWCRKSKVRLDLFINSYYWVHSMLSPCSASSNNVAVLSHYNNLGPVNCMKYQTTCACQQIANHCFCVFSVCLIDDTVKERKKFQLHAKSLNHLLESIIVPTHTSTNNMQSNRHYLRRAVEYSIYLKATLSQLSSLLSFACALHIPLL